MLDQNPPIPHAYLLLVLLGAGLAACGDDNLTVPPTTASIEVTTSTTGPEPDPDGYTVQMDAEPAQTIQIAGTIQHPEIAPGAHTVQLAGLAANCTVAGENPRAVNAAAGETATVTFEVTCGATTGGLQVTSSTSGPSTDPDGYTVTVDGTDRGALGVGGGMTLAGLAAGEHVIGLSGVAANCQVQGENPRTVTVTTGQSGGVAFAVTCAAPPANAGTLRIVTSTTGPDQDADGYTFAVDGTSSQPIGVNATADLANVAGGSHQVRLSGLADNCRLQGDNPRSATVSAGAMADVRFTVNCSASRGSLKVSAATSGESPDPNGYVVSVDGGTGQHLDSNGEVTFEDLRAGPHSVQLSEVASNCQVSGENPRQVIVRPNQQASSSFAISCSATGGNRWSSMESGTSSLLLEVWVTPSTAPLGGYAVGTGEILALRQGGWFRETLAQLWELEGVWGRSAEDAFAVGLVDLEPPPDQERAFRGVVLRRQAGAWLEMPGLTPPERTDGTPWASPWALNDVWGVGSQLFVAGELNSPMDAEVVGGFVAHYDGTAWSTTRLLPNEGVGFNGVSGTSASDVYLVGSAFSSLADLPGPAVVFHYNGATWSEVWRTERSEFSAVWAATPNSVFVVGADFTTINEDDGVTGFVLHYDGSTWSEVFREKRLYLTNVWGTSATDVYAVASSGTVLHYDGTSWTKQNTSIPSTTTVFGIWGRSPSDVYAVGESGTILHGTP
jgi:hypothetical protein